MPTGVLHLGTSTEKASSAAWTTTEVYTITEGQSLVVALAIDAASITSIEWNGLHLGCDTQLATATLRGSIWSLPASHAGSSAITVNLAVAVTAKAMAVLAVVSQQAIQIDQVKTASGSSDAPDTGLSGVTTAASELLMAAIATEGPAGDAAGAWAYDVTENGLRNGTTGGAADSNVTIADATALQTSMAQRRAGKTGITSRGWVAALATYALEAVWSKVWHKHVSTAGPRFGAAVAYDEDRGEVIVFGGNTTPVLNDTWAYAGGVWTNKAPAHAPSTNYGYRACMCWDPVNHNIVLFGGGTGGGPTNPSQTWTWNGTDWTQQAPATVPGYRYQATMCWDPSTGTVIMFGGTSPATMWSWNGSDWTQITPTGPLPTALYSASMHWDPKSGRVILFGGTTNVGTPRFETWAWDGTNWEQLSPITTPGSLGAWTGHFMWVDPVNNRLHIAGGASTATAAATMLCYSWTGSNWEPVVYQNPSALNPFGSPYNNAASPARYQHVIAYHAADRAPIIAYGSSPYGSVGFSMELLDPPAPVMRVRAPLPGAYVDNVQTRTAEAGIFCINTIPEEGETGVQDNAAINFHLVHSASGAAWDAAGSNVRVYVTPTSDSVAELAWSLVDGVSMGFEPGYAGGPPHSEVTFRASPGSATNDELVLSIRRDAGYSSEARVRVDIEAEVAIHGGFSLKMDYYFFIEDTAKADIDKLVWMHPRRVRVRFTEEMDTETTNVCHYADEGVEITSSTTVQLHTLVPDASWVGLWCAMTGSIYPENNQYRRVLSVDEANKTVVIGTALDPLTPDTGIDKNSVGATIRDRRLRLSITPYRLSARLSEEYPDEPETSPDRVQCAYLPIIVGASLPDRTEIPVLDDVSQYIILDVHDDISFGRLYTLTATDVSDSDGNSCGTDGIVHNFTSPAFSHVTVHPRVSMLDLLPDEYWTDDMESGEGNLRKIACVLQDVFNSLRYRIDQMQYLQDPDRIRAELLPFMLYSRGDPFSRLFEIALEKDKRRLAAHLDGMKRLLGTVDGIEYILEFFLGFKLTVRAYIYEYGWVLGEDLLEISTFLTPGSRYYRNGYEIISPLPLTDTQRRVVRAIAEWADPVYAHLIRIIEPSGPGSESVYWIVGRSALSYTTRLKST